MKPRTMWTVLSLLVVGAIALSGCAAGSASHRSGHDPVVAPGRRGGERRPICAGVGRRVYRRAPQRHLRSDEPGDTELLRQDFQTAALAGSPPDLLWTVNDHAGPFTTAELIVPVDDLVDLGQYADGALAAVELNGQHWGVPISNGNHLMLYYNKDLVPTPPADTDDLLAMADDLKAQGVTPLVYNQTEPFWLVPWLGGFGGAVFAEDGVTPTLNTPEMVATLAWLQASEGRQASSRRRATTTAPTPSSKRARPP